MLLSAATLGGTGAAPGGGGGAPGGLGAEPFGIGGAAARGGGAGFEALLDVVSGSESYAPVFTPPDFLSLGIPPANRPPSCGADSIAAPPDPPLCPWSLLLRALLGAGGRRPGTGGAPPAGGPALLFGLLSRMGADRSLIWVTFLSFAPLLMSLRSAPWHHRQFSAPRHVPLQPLAVAVPIQSTYSSLDFLVVRSRGKATWWRGRRRRRAWAC